MLCHAVNGIQGLVVHPGRDVCDQPRRDHMCSAKLPTLRDGEGIEGQVGLSQHQGHLVHCQPTGAPSKPVQTNNQTNLEDWHCNQEILIIKHSKGSHLEKSVKRLFGH